MTKGLKRKLVGYSLATALFLSPIHYANAEILERKILHENKEYEINIDTEQKEFSLYPDIGEKEAREMLASFLLDKLAYETEEKKQKLVSKTDEFFWQNPSKMQLKFSESILPLTRNISEFEPYNIPKTNINLWKKGNEVGLEFKLDSQDYYFDWYKHNSIGIFYPKGTKITRKVDEAYILAGEKNELGMQNLEKGSMNDEREAYGKLADAVLKKLYPTNPVAEIIKSSNPVGIITLSGVKLEDMLAKDVKTKREKIVEFLKNKYNYILYSPAYFFSTPEQGRLISINFDGKPDSFAFFINSDAELKKAEYGTQTKKSGALIKIIELDMDSENALDETAAGKIIEHAGLISKELENFLADYGHKKQLKNLSFEEKNKLYENLNLWSAQAMPFMDMLSSLQDKEIEGNMTGLPEHQRFQQEAQAIQDNAKSLNGLVNGYFFTGNYVPYLFNPRRTFEAYKKAMQERNWEMRDKTNFGRGLFRWERDLERDYNSKIPPFKKEAREIANLIPQWRFIKELPYTGDAYKGFINKNSVEAEVWVYNGFKNAFFVRTKEGWKLDRAGKSEAGLTRIVCSILNEISKNREIQKKIIFNGISGNFSEPSFFSCHYSNFAKLGMVRYGDRLDIKGAAECYDGSFEFRIKDTPNRVTIYHYGPDGKDEQNMLQYGPENGKGDIGISFDK